MQCNPIIDVSSVENARIYLGVFTTFHARSQTFDFSAWAERLGDGTFSVSLLRPGESIPYTVEDVTVDGTTAVWTFDAADTARSGYGKAFLSYAGDGFLDMTVDIPVYIAENSSPAGDTPPEPLEDWYQRVLQASAAAQDAAAEAAQSAADADAARQAIEDMTVSAHGVVGNPTVTKTVEEGVVNLDFGLPSGGAATDYDTLLNRPAINGVTLTGDKTLAELGIAAPFVHTQAAAEAEWTIAHNLGRYPSVTVVDSLRRVVGAAVRYPDENTVVLTFNAAALGTAYLN